MENSPPSMSRRALDIRATCHSLGEGPKTRRGCEVDSHSPIEKKKKDKKEELLLLDNVNQEIEKKDRKTE